MTFHHRQRYYNDDRHLTDEPIEHRHYNDDRRLTDEHMERVLILLSVAFVVLIFGFAYVNYW